ncbi:hypothetical protein LSTR_LSTR012553 [Laodelphax striatellus]|uniref:Uncharacterized protein n=1 Tax=Laodelphax striatellus TaxID=195883 RepID=A0A482XLG7_LAOST|nr:hypothetical protein LSTR_LSTR012553 [Laodelphax striatellus]
MKQKLNSVGKRLQETEKTALMNCVTGARFQKSESFDDDRTCRYVRVNYKVTVPTRHPGTSLERSLDRRKLIVFFQIKVERGEEGGKVEERGRRAGGGGGGRGEGGGGEKEEVEEVKEVGKDDVEEEVKKEKNKEILVPLHFSFTPPTPLEQHSPPLTYFQGRDGYLNYYLTRFKGQRAFGDRKEL